MLVPALTVGLTLVLVRQGHAHLQQGLMSISITRHHKGDMFVAQGTKCYKDLCVGMSSGTAGPTDSGECGCQCMPNLPIFRDDLNICVDDIHECTLAPFVSGTTSQKIPFVFLPLKGQIVYPSAEITVSDAATPICVVSGAQFLGRGGWVDLRNNSDTEPPFRLFRDEGRTYLQWLGDGEMRLAMEGRLILVRLMCKDAGGGEEHKIFTPCVAFRVAGNPSVREVMFATDVHSSQEPEAGLSVSEYVAIGVCSILLGLIYVASVFLYLHTRKRKQKESKEKDQEGAHLTVGEEGIVKSNPLLQATRRHLAAVAGQDNGGYSSDSGSCCSESDGASDMICPEEDDAGVVHQNLQISAIVHPYEMEYNSPEPLLNQDSNNIERLPEEDVSIVETLEGREDRPETVRAMGAANVRRKLYFNPAYFELDLLKAPPPAALEFLTKIREVIAIAKHKMSAKRFSPSLIGIPEEEYYARQGDKNLAMIRRPGSVLSVPASTDNKNRSSACPGCAEETDVEASNFNSAASGSCCPSDTKQRIIRKWLEDVPILKLQTDTHSEKSRNVKSSGDSSVKSGWRRQDPSKQKSKVPQDSEAGNEKASEDKHSVVNEVKKPPPPPARNETKRPSTKGPAPPRPPPPKRTEEKPEDPEKFEKREFPSFSTFSNFSFFSSSFKPRTNMETPPPIPKSNPGPLPSAINKINISPPPRVRSPPCPPPLPPPNPVEDPDNTPRVQGKDKVPPVVAKTLMDAVIKELVVQRKGDNKKPMPPIRVHNFLKKPSDHDRTSEEVKTKSERLFDASSDVPRFEVDSLERKTLEDRKLDNPQELTMFETADTLERIKDQPRNEEESRPSEKIPEEEEEEEEEEDEEEEDKERKQIDSCIDIFNDRSEVEDDSLIESVIETLETLEEPEKEQQTDDHDYEVILLNPEVAQVEEEEKDKNLKIYNLPEILSKNERSEGYSLVSEVYVNDGYTYSNSESGASSPTSHSSKENKAEKPGRLTIQVKDSPDNYKPAPDESDAFEPDTLDRKPGKLKIMGTITNWEDSANEKYSNQRFHDMDLECHHLRRKNCVNEENFLDSLERPHILLKSKGNFRKSSLEKEVNELFRNLESPKSKNFGSLREIYEAKSKHQKRRMETTSLVGSVTSDTDCNSTLSWSEDRRNKLLHRGIVLHMGNNETRKHKRTSRVNHMKLNYPDVVPPRPPKPPSLSATPVHRSAATTPGTRSYCPSPSTRSVCASPSRSMCTSPTPRSTCNTPPPPPRATCPSLYASTPSRSLCSPPPPRSACTSPPPRSICTSPPPRSICTSPPPRSICTSPPPRSICTSPGPRSGRDSPSHRSTCMSPPSRSMCTSPLPRGHCATSPCATPCRSMCASPTPPSRSACTSPPPPPRPPSKHNDNSPPLPPRNLKPPLPPKNAKSTRQRKVGNGSSGCNFARRPLPPLPTPRHYHDSTLSSISSRDLETLSTLSGASMDSLNSSDYEAFYTLPYDGNEGEIYDKAQDRLSKGPKSSPIYNDQTYQSPFMLRSPTIPENVFSTDEDIYNSLNLPPTVRGKGKEVMRHMRSRRTVDSVKKSWRKIIEKNMQGFPHKPEDSGYLSTDSNESSRRPKMNRTTSVAKIPERVETPGSQGSETEESLCDGASESGAESIATDSFFFGNFRKVTAVESLDSGVGSDLNKCYNHSFRLSDVEVNSDTERHSLPIMVRP